MSIPVPEFAVCPWPIDPACLSADWDALDPAVQDRAVMLASTTLHRLTGYRVGGCPITVRPCKPGCTGTFISPAYLDMNGGFGAGYGGGFFPHIESGGVWVNSCGCTTDCSCGALCEIALPGPVGGVSQVMLDGVVVPATSYRVDGNRLVWTGGGDCPWPTCQDLSLADTEVGTFSVTYLNSYPVDGFGAYAAGIMAAEFAKACTGAKCRLPLGTTAITRQGITFEVPSGAFPNGRTGIREVDGYLALYNPTPIRQAPQVWSPDLRRPRVTG